MKPILLMIKGGSSILLDPRGFVEINPKHPPAKAIEVGVKEVVEQFQTIDLKELIKK